MEVKPKGVPAITWAPAQAIVYARLFNIWLQHDPDAAEILFGMIAQRKRLGLIKSQAPVLPLTVGRHPRTDRAARHVAGTELKSPRLGGHFLLSPGIVMHAIRVQMSMISSLLSPVV